MYLAIDTSGQYTSIALFDLVDKQPVCKVSINSRNSSFKNNQIPQTSAMPTEAISSHSSSLAAMVGEVLAQEHGGEQCLKEIILGSGPGSFTGLRIGFSFSKGLALASGIPLSVVSTLRSIAFSFRHEGKKILVIDDARREQYFVAEFNCAEGFKLELEEQIVDRSFVLDWCNRNPEARLLSPQTLGFEGLTVVSNLAEKVGEYYLRQNPGIPAYDIGDISMLKPLYVRAVSALSIAERRQSGQGLL